MGEDTWTVKRILGWIEGFLAKHGDENPRVSAQWLVSEALGVSRMQLFLDAERPLTEEERATLRDWTRRRGAGEPLQYITGQVAFRHITLKVQPGVLIPRPETEVLVSEALALLPAARKPQDDYDEALIKHFAEMERQLAVQESGEEASARSGNAGEGAQGEAIQLDAEGASAVSAASQDSVESPHRSAQETDGLIVADICTGSGCIACSIAHEHPLTRVVASDIDPAAVRLARENVEALGLDGRVKVVHGDLGDSIDPALKGRIDLVVSNPPYVPSAVLFDIPSEVADFEPRLALDGGEDGLAVYRRLIEWCASWLCIGGAFAFELHETCLAQAAEEACAAGFESVRIVDDLANRPRVLTGVRTR